MNKQVNFSSYLDKERKKIELKIETSLKNRKPESLYNPAKYIMQSGGKRLRPLLVVLSAKAVNKNIKDIYNAAIAVEFLHNFTLVHDDIMDNADKRRGRLTLHKKYDNNTAILAGDSLLSIAYELLLKDCKTDTNKIVEAFTQSLIEICEGQSMDKDFEMQKQVSIEEYYVMIEKKTAVLAEMCCKIGGLIAGGSKEEVKTLANFGKCIGIAFQIQDDLLDLTADEAEFGKIIGGDLVEGKKTYLFLQALSKAKGNDRKMLLEVIKNKGIKPKEIDNYKQLYIKLGVIEDAKKEIIKYTSRALKLLKNLKNDEDKELFKWLAGSLINRNK